MEVVMTDDHGRSTKQSQKKPVPPIQKEGEEHKLESPAVESPGLQLKAGDNPPTLQQVTDKVRQTWGKEARQRSFASIQRHLGNKTASQVAAEVHGESQQDNLLQRHPIGADLVPQAPNAKDDVNQARGGREVPGNAGAEGASTPSPEAPSPAGPSPEGGTTAQAPAPASPGPEAGPAPETPAPAGPGPEVESTPESGPTTEGEATPESGSTTAPAPVLTGTMTTAFAQQALADAFGEVAGDIVPGNITVVPNVQALYAAYDQWCIDHNVNKADGTAWARGDAEADDIASGTRMNAFAEPEPGTNIWVDSSGTDPTATVHEMLHINTGSGFRAAVGEIVNEGVTQRLAVRAVQQAGESVAGSENTYQREQEVVQAITDLVGDETVTSAYFGGAASLISQYNTAIDDDNGWATLKALLDANDFASALTLLRDNTSRASISRINELLSGWVSDADLTGIQAVYDASSSLTKTAIRTAIEPRTHEVFWRRRTRIRVREIIEAT